MDDRFNTAAGWVLFAGIVALGGSIVSGMYFTADKHAHVEEPGFFIEGVAEDGGADAGPDLGTLLASIASPKDPSFCLLALSLSLSTDG